MPTTRVIWNASPQSEPTQTFSITVNEWIGNPHDTEFFDKCNDISDLAIEKRHDLNIAGVYLI
jgi:hypothetical protein